MLEAKGGTALLIAACLTACASGGEGARQAGLPAVDSVALAAANAGDTDVVRGLGVPTDRDDTLGTRYGKHEAPREVAAPDCRPGGIALCVTDTATTVRSVECCMADQRETRWLVFAAAGDSMQLFLYPDGSYLDMDPPSAGHYGAEHSRGVDASWIRPRFAHRGAYVFTVGIQSDDPIEYDLRVAPVIARGASRPVGKSATLTITGKPSSKVVIAPASLVALTDTAALRSFAVTAGTYRVLLVRDTSYLGCRLPCSAPRRFSMRPGQAVTYTP
ncbi:MAG TPA: hypothetical protein VGQ44_07605 [Gemmatimonadaceae bacterium]|jgi:hypothetical protein|nr:hypothetical protein [Gemmatimonadaceae bacterium]